MARARISLSVKSLNFFCAILSWILLWARRIAQTERISHPPEMPSMVIACGWCIYFLWHCPSCMGSCCKRKAVSRAHSVPGLRGAARSYRISPVGLPHSGVIMSPVTNENERMNRPLDVVDPQIADLLRDEARRQ